MKKTMANAKKSSKLNLFGFASAMVLAGVIHPTAFAQEADTLSTSREVEESTQPKTLDTIVVTGYKQSLENALNSKRNSGNVTDAIAAEDIGKSTDQNIAEALQRVTGISISRVDGEGTSIVARGVSADFNNITLNGVSLTSSGNSQGVDLSQFSADVLAGIQVIKTPSADHDEGSLGASIQLNGFKPLDAKKDRRVLEVQSRYSPFADDNDISLHDVFGGDRKFSLSLSEKFLDDRLGVALVASSETQTTRQDIYDVNSFPIANLPTGATNIETGEVITEFDYGNGLEPIKAITRNGVFYETKIAERDRDTITGTLQFQPDATLDIQVDLTWSEQTVNNDNFRFNVLTNRNNRATATDALAGNLLFDPNSYTLIRDVNTAEDVRQNNRNRPFPVQFLDIKDETTNENFVFSGTVEKEVGDWTFTLRGGQSKTTSSLGDNLFVRFSSDNSNAGRRNGLVSGYDCQPNPEICSIVLTDGFADDPTNFLFHAAAIREREIEDTASSLYFDVDWDHSFGPIAGFEAGFKWSSQEKEGDATNLGLNNFETAGVLRANGQSLADFLGEGRTPGDYGKEFGLKRDSITDGFFRVDGELVLEELERRGAEGLLKIQQDLNNTRAIKNDVLGGYLKANIDTFNGRLTGDVGLRVVQTEVEASGFSGFRFANGSFVTREENIAFYGSAEAALAALGRDTIGANVTAEAPTPIDPEPFAVSGTHEYTNVLPSMNLNYMASDDIILRFAASQTIARPRIDDLKPGFIITEDIFNPNSRGSFGSTQLDPYKSTNLDLSFEWYFQKSSLLSFTLFNKDFTDFAETTSYQSYYADFREEFYNIDGSIKENVSFSTDIAGVLLPLSGGANTPGCFPNREQDMAVTVGDEGCDVLIVTQSRNGQGGYVRGLETSFQHNFDYLPGLLSGMGVQANYTYSDSAVDEEVDDAGNVLFPGTPLDGTSKHTFNTTVFYEKDGVLLRLAYNNRSDYLINRSTNQNNLEWIEGFDTLDMSASWDITDRISLNFQGQNLTDTVTRTYTSIGQNSGSPIPAESTSIGDAPNYRTNRLTNTGPTYRLGLRYQF
ncbi:TonB-dependent receptor [Hirschia litorea]|uniref:TonB-dependent receptor n=1 Tax=Hirschia litorea TaxID=1199156 RepID=A0ABW2IPR5_9PROT